MHPAQTEELKDLFERSDVKEMLYAPIKLWRLEEKESGITHIIAVVNGQPAIHYEFPEEFKFTSPEGQQFGRELQRFIEGRGSDVFYRATELLIELGLWAVEGGGKRKREKLAKTYAAILIEDMTPEREKDKEATGLNAQDFFVEWRRNARKVNRRLTRLRDWKYHLAERILNAMAELRAEGKSVSKTAVAVRVYGQEKEEQEQDVMTRRVELRRDLRNAELTFEKLLEVNKKWSELSRLEKQELFS